jgi:hypothetical protein
MTITRFVPPLGFAVAVLTAAASHAQAPTDPARRESPPAAQPAEAGRRVVVTAATAPAYSCAAVTCRVVSDLEKGAILSVLKTDGDWHQVLVRTAANAMTTGWVRGAQVAATADVRTRITGTERSDGVFRPTHAALADAATKKGSPDTRVVTPGLADGRTSDERMRDLFAERYDPELKRLAGIAASVDAGLQSYLATCFQRFASIPVEGAAPRSTAVDDILKAARASRGAARFALWSGTAAFQWNPSWAPQASDNSSQPSCERLWEDVRGRADALKVDLEFLERDAREHDIYPGVVREMLAARGLAEGGTSLPTSPVTDIR